MARLQLTFGGECGVESHDGRRARLAGEGCVRLGDRKVDVGVEGRERCDLL